MNKKMQQFPTLVGYTTALYVEKEYISDSQELIVKLILRLTATDISISDERFMIF